MFKRRKEKQRWRNQTVNMATTSRLFLCCVTEVCVCVCVCVFARVWWCVTFPAPDSNGEPCWNIHSVTLSLQYLHWKTTGIQPELPATLQPLSSAFSVTEKERDDSLFGRTVLEMSSRVNMFVQWSGRSVWVFLIFLQTWDKKNQNRRKLSVWVSNLFQCRKIWV